MAKEKNTGDILNPVQNKEAKKKAVKTKKAVKKNNNSSKASSVIISVVVILILALAIVGFAYKQVVQTGVIERHTTALSSENYSVSESMLSFYFNSYYRSFINSNSSYLSSYGIDTTKSLKSQDSQFTGGTWYEYFSDYAKGQAEQFLTLAEYAKANNITLDADDKAEIEASLADYKTYAKSSGVSVNTYVAYLFGSSVNFSDVKKATELQAIATKASQYMMDQYNYTEDDYVTYRDENSSDFTYIDFLKYTFTATTDSDGNIDADSNAAVKAKAEELLAAKSETEFKDIVKDYLVDTKTAALEEGETLSDEDNASIDTTVEGIVNTLVAASSADSDISEIFYADTAKVGDVKDVFDETTGSYTVYMLTKTAYYDETLTKNIAAITLNFGTNYDLIDEAAATAKADEIIAEWDALSEKTDEAFFELCKKYDTTGSVPTELTENVTKSDVTFADILFGDDAIEKGETEKYVDTTNSVVYIVYNGGDGMITWQATADSALKEAQWSEDYQAMSTNDYWTYENVEVTADIAEVKIDTSSASTTSAE